MDNQLTGTQIPFWRRFGWRYAILGAVVFWLPDIAYQAAYPAGGPGLFFFVLNASQPLCLFSAYAICRRFLAAPDVSIALNMLAGLWLFSPVLQSISFSFSGGGFTRLGWVNSVLAILEAIAIPLFTVYLAAFNIFGLVAAVLGLIVLHRRLERGKPLLRPRGRDVTPLDARA